jgi:hypothetical protein
LTLGDGGDKGDKVPDRPLGNHGDFRRCSRVGAAIDPIGASRSGERGVVGTGSLLQGREDQRSTAIVILRGPGQTTRRGKAVIFVRDRSAA